MCASAAVLDSCKIHFRFQGSWLTSVGGHVPDSVSNYYLQFLIGFQGHKASIKGRQGALKPVRIPGTAFYESPVSLLSPSLRGR